MKKNNLLDIFLLAVQQNKENGQREAEKRRQKMFNKAHHDIIKAIKKGRTMTVLTFSMSDFDGDETAKAEARQIGYYLNTYERIGCSIAYLPNTGEETLRAKYYLYPLDGTKLIPLTSNTYRVEWNDNRFVAFNIDEIMGGDVSE